MNTPSCQSPLDWQTLLAYWLGELDSDQEARVEEHYLGCEACSGRLALLAELARETRALTQASGVNMVVDKDFVQRLRSQGFQLREYRLPFNGSVNCTVAPEDDFVVAHLEAPLADVERLDMISIYESGDQLRQEDIPFNAGEGSVVFAPPIDALRALPQTTVRVRLVAVGRDEERALAEYRFNHTPHAR